MGPLFLFSNAGLAPFSRRLGRPGTSPAHTASLEERRRPSAMKGYVDDIERVTTDNTDFRRVLYTGHNLQLVAMSLKPGEEIGAEVHDDRDQFFRIEAVEGIISIDGVDNAGKDDDAVIVPQGARHNVKATGSAPLKLYTIYGPPEHIDGTVHATSEDAEASHEH